VKKTKKSQAIQAFGSFCRQYVSKDSAFAGIAKDYMALLRHEKPVVRRGSAAALGALPPWMLQPFAQEVLQALAMATEVGASNNKLRGLHQMCTLLL